MSLKYQMLLVLLQSGSSHCFVANVVGQFGLSSIDVLSIASIMILKAIPVAQLYNMSLMSVQYAFQLLHMLGAT